MLAFPSISLHPSPAYDGHGYPFAHEPEGSQRHIISLETVQPSDFFRNDRARGLRVLPAAKGSTPLVHIESIRILSTPIGHTGAAGIYRF
jgi:hypothetical protein